MGAGSKDQVLAAMVDRGDRDIVPLLGRKLGCEQMGRPLRRPAIEEGNDNPLILLAQRLPDVLQFIIRLRRDRDFYSNALVPEENDGIDPILFDGHPISFRFG
jgi:hypothetical protein